MQKTIRIRVGGVLEQRGKVLLACHEKEGKKYWLLPGGGVNFGETLQEALQREFLEETSLRVSVGKLLIMNETVAPDGSRHGIHFTFLVRNPKGKLKAGRDHRLTLVEFRKWDDLKSLLFRPNIAKTLLSFRKKKFQVDCIYLQNIWVD